MVIDIHTHAFPDPIVSRAMEVLIGNSGLQPFTDGTYGGLRDSMKRAGVDLSVIAPIATKPAQARGVNRCAVEINKANDALISLGSLHPEQDDWRSEIDGLVASKIKGVKFHPDYQEFYVDEPRLTPVYRALAEAELIVLFHAGVDIGLAPPVHCTPDRLARVLDAVPELTVIAGHMGGYKRWDDVQRYLVGRDLFFDTSFSRADLGDKAMASLMREHGVDRMLFGTDSPWTDQEAEVEGIRALGFNKDEQCAILGGNAAKLLGL